jgi:hypothetical protein
MSFFRIVVLFLVMIPFCLSAQRTRTIELKPIYKQGFTYYYDMKKVKTPYALQVPLLGLEDDEITRRYKNFNRLTTIGNLASLIPVVYILSYTRSNSYVYHADAFLWVFLATIGFDLTFDLLAHGQLKRGIDRYNQLIVVPSSAVPGLSLKYRF